MSQMKKTDILEAISNMSVMDVVDLVKMMEEKFGISAQEMVAVPKSIPCETVTAAIEEKTEFDVKIINFGENKIGVIKVVRSITGLGLKEAKDLVESVPSLIKGGISREEADKIKKELEEVGATVALQ
ncbi:50S ribosomal protein L7/L12 [Coxiella endosymbiont of Amblyomma americanum]|uniref:50S ribosomal protein L7/L12 n=1 Tax=Coxiella endosymbiont of Amblyomma americanum TaxID=325775 RepID=UPI00057C4626|nr:50S ribosomal protein L7/L12 [Coxiella endosymbiont of Amblyomma americanum]AJC50415.1 50S ribosomal protein L7/L12 [Coxiella endosymbiont of Amblyomma americanum]AUJ58756.1 50S ribosomal protein L7/L12 [Coxiella-like endosymbiont of Amblyomma americanum]